MNGVTDPAETYFKQGLWAWDAVSGAFVRLAVDASGYLKVTGLTLAPGAATAAHQVTQNTALQLIDDLRNALHTVHTDELDVVIDGQTSDVEIVQQAPADLTAALHGYIGGAWQKLPFLFGVSDTYAEVESEDNATAGTNTLTCSTVPAGEVWLITNICAWNGTSQCTIINAVAWIDSTAHNLFREVGPAVGAAVNRQGWWVLGAGDYLTCGFTDCILNDNIRLHITGFKMDIDL